MVRGIGREAERGGSEGGREWQVELDWPDEYKNDGERK